MMPLSAAQLSKMQQAHSATLTGQCDILRRSASITDAGGTQDTWSVVAEDVPCRLMPERDRRLLEIIGAGEASIMYYRLTVPFDTDLRSHDRISYGAKTYRVTAIWGEHSLKTAIRATVIALD